MRRPKGSPWSGSRRLIPGLRSDVGPASETLGCLGTVKLKSWKFGVYLSLSICSVVPVVILPVVAVLMAVREVQEEHEWQHKRRPLPQLEQPLPQPPQLLLPPLLQQPPPEEHEDEQHPEPQQQPPPLLLLQHPLDEQQLPPLEQPLPLQLLQPPQQQLLQPPLLQPLKLDEVREVLRVGTGVNDGIAVGSSVGASDGSAVGIGDGDGDGGIVDAAVKYSWPGQPLARSLRTPPLLRTAISSRKQ